MKSKQKQISLLDYLDSSLAGQEPPLQTLNILTATADQFIKNKGGRDKSKSVVAQSNANKVDGDHRKRSNEKERSLIQTKYLNFQRDASSKKTRSNSQDRKKNALSKKGLGKESSNSRSRSRDQLTKEVSRDRNLLVPKSGNAVSNPPHAATLTHSKDSNLRKKQIKASNNLLAMINHSKKQKSSAETVNISLKNMASPQKKKSVDDRTIRSGSSNSHLINGKLSRGNQSLSPRNLAEKYKADVPKHLGRSQNLLSKQINIQSQTNVAKSAPGFQNVTSIETSNINNSLVDREFILHEADDTSIFRNAKSTLEQTNDRNPRKNSKSVIDDQSQNMTSSQQPAKQKKSRSPKRDNKQKPGASKIDKLIRENLRKQIRKDLEQKDRERQQKLEQKRKRLELEQANERVRRHTETQVQRSKEKIQKLQMMKQLQVNLANSGLTNTLGEKSLDQNLKNLLARTEKDEITAEMTKLLQQIDERPQLQKRIKPKKLNDAQTQLQTQKFEGPHKLENVDQLERLLENNSLLNGESDAFQKQPDSYTQQNAEIQLLGQGGKKKREDGQKDKSFVDKARDHRRSHGLEFFDMRKEILNELKQLGHKVKIKFKKQEKHLKACQDKDEQTLEMAQLAEQQQEYQKLLYAKPQSNYIQLRGSKSQRQLIEQAASSKQIKQSKRPLLNQKKAESIFQAIVRDQGRLDCTEINEFFNEPEIKPKKQFSLDMSKLLDRTNVPEQQHAPIKKQMIRRFMKARKKQKTLEAEKQMQKEIKKTLKVHANLVKLNDYCKKQLLNTTGRGNAIQLTNKISVPSVQMPKCSIKIRHRNGEARKSDLDVEAGNELTITPNRMLFEDSEPSLNVSGTRISRGGTAGQVRRDASKTRTVDVTDDLYEDSKMQSMQTLEERPISSLRRPIAKRPNKFQTSLAPCFEKSNSAKTLRAQLAKKSQSPQKASLEPKKTNQSLITGNQVKQSAQPAAQPKRTRKIKYKKRGKSITKGSGGPTVYMNQGGVTSKAGLNQRLNVKIPSVRIQRRGSSVGTLESQDDDSLRSRSSRKRQIKSRIGSSVKKQKQSQAALVIQREVRKYLKRLGFYEAKQILSPDREPQINLFIEKRHEAQFRPSKTQSKSRSGSRSSGKKNNQIKKTFQGSPKQKLSSRRKISPNHQQTRSNQNSSQMQKTTIIAEISGLKQRNYFIENENHSSESDQNEKSLIERVELQNLEERIGDHARIQSMQILDSSNYPSAKSGTRLSGLIQSSPDESQPLESGRLINLNQVQVLPQFSRMTFLDGLHEDKDVTFKQSPQPKKPKKSDKALKQLQPHIKPRKPEQKKPTDVKPQKTFNYQIKQPVPISESVSILDRLHGTSAANNFSKDDESNAFMPKKPNFFDKKLPALINGRVENRYDVLWLPETDQMQSVSTPRSGLKIAYPEHNSQQSLAQKSVNASDIDMQRKQLSVESKRSSQIGFGFNDAVSQSSSSVFDRNAFQQFTNSQKSSKLQNADYQKLIKFREDCLLLREEKEKKHIQKLLKNNQCSPRTYHAKKEQIDRWVNVEKMEIERTKVTFQQEWDKTVKMIEETQKSVDQIRSRISHSQPSNINSVNVMSSINSGQKQLHGSSISGSAKKPSILIEDPPKSYRSSHQDQAVMPIEKASALSSHRSASYGLPAENLIQYMEKRLANQQDLLVSVRTQDKAESERVHATKLSAAHDDELEHSRFRANSHTSSECSQQPSAEFLERLEKVKRKEQELQMLHMNIAHLDEPEFDNKMGHLNSDIEDRLDGFVEYIPGLDVHENEFHDKNFLNSDLKDQLDHKIAPVYSNKSTSKNNVKSSDSIYRQKDEQSLKDQRSNSESSLNNEPSFQNEPAIISNSVGHFSNEGQEQTFVSAKTRTETKTQVDLKILLQDGERREDIADLLTDSIIENLIKECVAVPLARRVDFVPQPAKKEDEEAKDANVDVFVVDSQLREKEEKKEWIEIRQRHLIENDLIRIDQYINEIVDSLLQFEIDPSSEDSQTTKNDQANYHIMFLKQLTQPILKEPTEILQALQTSEIGSYKHFETTQDLQKYPIIPVDLYLDIEKAREEAMITRKGPNINRETQLVWESIHIQNKSFFDAVNESLMKFRPYGLTGEPMPWSNKIRRLQTKVDISSVDTERLFQMVKQEVFRWAQTYCGCLPSPIFAFPSLKNRGQEEFSNELFQEFREKRQTQVLWTETVEQEHHWLNFDYEEAQVKIDLSDMILEHLVDELVEIMAGESEGLSDVPAVKKQRNPPPTSPFNELADSRASRLDPEAIMEASDAKKAQSKPSSDILPFE